MFTTPTLGINLDLVDPQNFKPSPSSKLEEDDELLMKESGPSKPSRKIKFRPRVPWLRKTEYVAIEFDRGVKNEPSVSEAKVEVKKESEYVSSSERMTIISKSFEARNEDIVHPTDKSIKVKKITPLLPSFDMWGNNHFRVTFADGPFDSNVAPQNANYSRLDEAVLLSGVVQTAKGVEKVSSLYLPQENESAATSSQQTSADYQETQMYSYQTSDLIGEYVMIMAPDEAIYFPLSKLFTLKRKKGTPNGSMVIKRTKYETKSREEKMKAFVQNLAEEEEEFEVQED
jgi:hypothetical protein